MIFSISTAFLSIVIFFVLQRQIPNIFPFFLIIVLKFSMLQLCLTFSQLLFLGRLIKLLFCTDQGQFVLFLVFILEIL